MKRQDGFLRKKSGSWLGCYSRWVLDFKTGKRTRVQKAFKIGSVKGMKKSKALEKLRERLVEELGRTYRLDWHSFEASKPAGDEHETKVVRVGCGRIWAQA